MFKYPVKLLLKILQHKKMQYKIQQNLIYIITLKYSEYIQLYNFNK